MHQTQLIYSCAAGLRPHFDGTDGWIVFLNAAVVINATTVIIQFMTNSIDSDGVLFINDVLFERMLCGTQIRQYFVNLLEKKKTE